MHKLTARLAILATALVANQARATSPDTYAFAIRVTQQDGQHFCPAKGQLLFMRLTVDRSFPPSQPKNHAVTYQGSTNPPQTSPILSVSFSKDGSHTSNPIDAEITVQKNDKGVSGYDFLGFTFSEGFVLKFSTTAPDIVNTYRLPGSIHPKSFQTASFEYDTAETGPCYGNIVAR